MPAIRLLEAEALPPVTDGPDRLALVDAVAGWRDGLRGCQPPTATLRRLAERLGAQAACLSRLTLGSGGTTGTLAWNAPGSRGPAIEVAGPLAASMLGTSGDRLRAASVWVSSRIEGGADPALAAFQRRAHIAETAVIVLAMEGKRADVLELHFAQHLGRGALGLLTMVAGTLSRTWIDRAPGLFPEVIPAAPPASRPGLREPLLGLGNPARLSRAEFRVCLHLARGLDEAATCQELGIGPSTLKTHLRNILAKTRAASLAELLLQLGAPPARTPALRRA